MNKKEIYDYIVSGKSGSGIPCGFWTHFPKGCERGTASVNAHLEYYKDTHVPLYKMMNEHPLQLNCAISRPEDWQDVRSDDRCPAYYDEFLDEIARFRAEAGKDAFILATIHGVLVSACHATDGMGRFPDLNNTITRHLKENPAAVSQGLKEIGRTLALLSSECIKAGADGLYYAALGAEEERFTEALYTEYVKPVEKEILQSAISEGVVVLHVCKDNPRLPMFADYPCHMVNWAEHSSSYTLEDGMRIFPGKCILGGFDNKGGLIFDGSDDDVLKHIDGVVSRIGKGRIAIGADCTLPTDFNLSRIRMISDYCCSL